MMLRRAAFPFWGAALFDRCNPGSKTYELELDWIRENCHNEKIEENFEFLSEKKRKIANL